MEEDRIHIYFGAAGMLTALGDRDSSLKKLSEGISGIVFNDGYGMMTAAIDDRLPQSAAIPGYTRFESLMIARIEEVLNESGLKLDSREVQLIISTTKGNVDLLAGSCEPVPEGAFLYTAARKIADRFSAANPPLVISNACISGVSAFVVAERMIRSGRCRHAVIAGGDLLCRFVTEGFASFKSISERPCRPYDRDRNGLTLGEAVAAVVLSSERALALTPVVELVGGAVSNDANHISGPSRTGDGLSFAIDHALKESGFTSDQVGFVNTHGTATVYNDEMESKALKLSGLSATPLNSVKGYIGHTLGASGVVETILCADEIRQGRIFGTVGYRNPGTPCPVNISPLPMEISAPVCVKTASGFGGCNAAVVLCSEESSSGLERMVSENGISEAEEVSRYRLPESQLPFPEFIREEFRAFGHPDMKFYKMSDLCKSLYVSVEHLLEGVQGWKEVSPVRRAIILSNRVSSLEADVRHQQILNENHPEGASPAVFVYTLPNVAAGEMCIRHKIQGDNTFFIEDGPTSLAEDYSRFLIENDLADMVISGFCDKLDENWNVDLKLFRKRSL